MSNAVTQSQFYMWRTLFALTHADNIVTDEEIKFMANALEGVNFTDAQTTILMDDINNAKDVKEMFSAITDKGDRLKFFDFARELVWCDGNFDSEEQAVMVQLMEGHVQETNVDDLVGSVSLELENDVAPQQNQPQKSNAKHSIIDIVTSFRNRFS